jgi:prepilin signal peptidase PulO-like enzyme (type II secretory pathway)
MMIIGSYMIGAVVTLALIASGKISLKKKKRIAFAPFLGSSTVLVLIGVGDFYLSLIS